ncbi:hypothetical protein Tco_1568838 [Tanacetum coccineum]
MGSQDARLSKFEADFKQQQGEMTNKIDKVLKAITNRITGALPSDTVKNPKLNVNSTSPVSSARSYPAKDPQCSAHDGDIIFVEIIKKYDDSRKEELREDGNAVIGGPEVEYFNTFLTMSELAYHKYLMCGPTPSLFLRNPIILEGCPSSLKIPCNIRHVHVEKAYIDLNSPLNIMTRMLYNWIMRRKLDPKEDTNRGVSNFMGRIKRMHIFVGNFTYVAYFIIVEDISSIIDPSVFIQQINTAYSLLLNTAYQSSGIESKRDGKITTWEELVETFFYKFYPESYDGVDEMLDEGDNWGIDPIKFLSNINTSFKNHKKVDGRTKKVLFHAWMNGNWNKRRINDSVLRSNNTTTDSFFKPYLITHGKSDTEKKDEQSQTKRTYSNTSNSIDEQPNKRRCKAEKFEAIQYSLGPNKEYIAIRVYEFDIWERNDDNLSIIYQDIFLLKDEGWKVTRTKTLEAKNIDEYWWRIYKSGDLEVLES